MQAYGFYMSTIHYFVDHTKSALDGYNIMAHSQSPQGEYEWDF